MSFLTNISQTKTQIISNRTRDGLLCFIDIACILLVYKSICHFTQLNNNVQLLGTTRTNWLIVKLYSTKGL